MSVFVKKFVQLSDLVEWKDNPRDMDEAGKTQLKGQLLRLGQHTPLLVTEDNGFQVIIGGNMRTRALRELVEEGHIRFNEVWVSQIDFRQEGKFWYAYIDGIKQGQKEDGTFEHFASKDQGMFEYSLSSNGRAGFYNDELLAKQAKDFAQFGTNLAMYHVDTAYTTGLDSLVSRYDMADFRAKGGEAETADKNILKDAKKVYDNATIKQIVLYYPTAEYEDMLAFLQKLEEENEDVQSNTEAINFLRKFYEAHQ